MAASMYLLVLMVSASYLVSGRGVSERESPMASYEELFSGVPPEAVGFICSTLCEDGDRDADLLNAMTAMQQEVDEVKAMLTSVRDLLAQADLTPVRPEWKQKYPIYMVESPSGHYQLSKYEAESACEESGGHLANFNQLTAAFNAGLDWCSCGWITEGYAAYPIQFPRDGCNIELGPGLRSCHWQSTWNAWCIQGDYYS